jgi:hypothetical protein
MSDPPITLGSRFGFIPRVSCTKGVLCADRIVKVSYRGASRRASEDQWILQPKTYESIQRHCSAATNSLLDGFSAPRPYRKREHGLAPEMGVRRWQDRLTPAWKRIGGGCHLNRPIREMIANAGFHFEHLESAYMRRPKPFACTYEGTARPY